MLAEDVVLIAEKAGRMMTQTDGLTVTDKDSKDNHVTNMDVEVQKFLKKELTSLIPGSSFLGEEEDFDGADGEYHWIVDPIDGTTNFIRNLQMSVTSIALAHKGELILGVVYNPYTKEMFHAEKGKGAFRNGKSIHVSNRTVEHSIFATSWGAYDKTVSKHSFNISNRLFYVCEDIRRMGSAAYEICKMAEGSIDLYFEPILHPWDHAAASVILTEAGGFIKGEAGRASLRKRDRVLAASTEDGMAYLSMVVDQEYSDG